MSWKRPTVQQLSLLGFMAGWAVLSGRTSQSNAACNVIAPNAGLCVVNSCGAGSCAADSLPGGAVEAALRQGFIDSSSFVREPAELTLMKLSLTKSSPAAGSDAPLKTLPGDQAGE